MKRAIFHKIVSGLVPKKISIEEVDCAFWQAKKTKSYLTREDFLQAMFIIAENVYRDGDAVSSHSNIDWDN